MSIPKERFIGLMSDGG